MHDLNDLYYFAQVVEAGGFSAAARRLDIPKSRLSRRIALLEERLQMRLLQRTTRRLSLTTAGERYLQYCRAVTESALAADEAIEQLRAEPSGTVVMSAPIALAHEALPKLMPEFLRAWPKVSVQIIASNRRIDLIREGVDLALRVREKLDTDAEMVARQLGSSASYLVASPEFLRRHGAPQHPAELAEARTLAFSDTRGPVRWALQGPREESVSVTVTPQLACNDFPVLVEAAIHDGGIVLLPDVAVADPMRAGKLVQVLPNWSAPTGIVHIIYPSRRGMLPAVRTLVDFLARRLPHVYAMGPHAPQPPAQ